MVAENVSTHPNLTSRLPKEDDPHKKSLKKMD
ncbi:hypothetical protein BC643_2259 [Mangrovibacterium diazotrophicum]|uniref:Uncharacterized protein n=1 Tax=Mangrovibacterium diazotrophicum TaxID=1261403 RepID=A0A419W8X2_9BACT|nr:hypothetical protein BC643_2259 [Mangrovibacterium diazotrophicum]